MRLVAAAECTAVLLRRSPQRGDNIDNLEYALSIATGALAYYETVFNVSYPLPKVGGNSKWQEARAKLCSMPFYPSPCRWTW